jgi:5-methylthioribose kinase
VSPAVFQDSSWNVRIVSTTAVPGMPQCGISTTWLPRPEFPESPRFDSRNLPGRSRATATMRRHYGRAAIVIAATSRKPREGIPWVSSCDLTNCAEYCAIMPPLTAETIVAYLKVQGHLPTDVAATAVPLAWGVSNVVLRVEPQGLPPLVVKQSQPQLRTKIEWLSRCERIYREADVLRALETVLPPGVLPKVLFEDRENYVLGLEAVCPGHVVWKASLLRGEVNHAVAKRLGLFLATMHSGTWQRPEVLPDPDDWSLFDELRIDPFYRWLARHHPEQRGDLEDLIAEMAAHRVCLVHADFSPKNVLVNWPQVSLVDFETGHFGDPAFDLGFFLSHLLLKCLLFDNREEWMRLIECFLSTYQARMAKQNLSDECAAAWQRTTRHTAACLWARVDGKSPVDYLSRLADQEFVRKFAGATLQNPLSDLRRFVREFFKERDYA